MNLIEKQTKDRLKLRYLMDSRVKPFDFENSLLGYLKKNEGVLFMLYKKGLISYKLIRNYKISNHLYYKFYIENEKQSRVIKDLAREHSISKAMVYYIWNTYKQSIQE